MSRLVLSLLFLGLSGHFNAASAGGLRTQQKKSACIAQSVKLGSPQQKKLIRCYERQASRLQSKYQKSKKRKGKGLDEELRFRKCAEYFEIKQVPEVSSGDDFDTPSNLSKSYIERFQKRLIPYGSKVASCHVDLAKEKIVSISDLKKGSLVVELELGSDGHVRQVILVEKTNLNSFVSGCVVRELCGLWTSPPPSGKKFYLELPFRFKQLQAE